MSLMITPFVLASGSATRAAMLRKAGLDPIIDPSTIDEDAIKDAVLADGDGLPVGDIAAVLAEAKAIDVAARHPGKVVLGADQTLDLDGALISKATSVEDVRAKLLAMRGKVHTLHSAAVFARDGAVERRIEAAAHLTMRDFSPEFLGRYLAEVGPVALQSVGGYQLEGPGFQLFEAIEGDYFTILGLPLLPVLATLRDLGVVDA